MSRNVHFVNSSGAAWPWQRQIPGADSVWGETRYALDCEPDSVPDWLVVYEGWATKDFVTTVPRGRRIFITGEPESFHRYQPGFLDQFGHVITTQRRIKHPGVIRSQVAINWFAGVRFNGVQGPHTAVLRFEDLAAGNPQKARLCSVVSSTKAVTAGHRQRLAFVLKLKEALGDRIDVFGRGFHEIADKDEALASYRYHIALENSSHPDYWTEKLADPYLRGCFPIYAGCPNLGDYFPEGSWVSIDISRPDEAIARIREILDSDLDRQRAAELAEAKRRILWEHNVFALLERTYARLEAQETSVQPAILPTRLHTDRDAKDMLFSRRLARGLRRVLGLTPRPA